MFSSSPTEKRDLIIGTSIFVLVEMSFAIYYTNTLIELLILGILTIPLWLFHELAHKFVAQGNGLISDFRLDPNMALFSLFSILLPIKIIAPGVVLSSGEYRLDTAGRISIAGPLTNILIGGIFLVFSAQRPESLWRLLLRVSHRSLSAYTLRRSPPSPLPTLACSRRRPAGPSPGASAAP